MRTRTAIFAVHFAAVSIALEFILDIACVLPILYTAFDNYRGRKGVQTSGA